jgi:large subunit ribosomal protein L25
VTTIRLISRPHLETARRRLIMPEIRIQADVREEFGNGAARRIRREGKVPAVLYGHGDATVHLSLPGHELMLALKTPNVLLNLDVDGKRQLAIPKDVQRNPVRRTIEHVDLLSVRRGETVTVEVPVQTEGDIAPGGGLLEHTLTTLSVLAEATHIPQAIVVSIQGLQVGDVIHAKDISLPQGTQLETDGDAVVLHVMSAPTAADLATGEAAEDASDESEA